MAKYRTRMCIEGWYYLFMLAFIVGGALMREINLLLFVAGILMGPLLISWRVVQRSLHQVSVTRVLPAGIGAGERLVVDVAVRNGRRRRDAWGLIVEDCVVRQEPGANMETETVRVFFPHVRAGQSCEANYQGRLHERGKYLVGPMVVSTRFPLGLLRRSAIFQDRQVLYVYPRLGRLTPNWLQMVRPVRVGSRRSQHRRGFVEGEFHGLRDWRSGDSKRWIHWRTSARRNTLTVREFERQQSQNIDILLDLWQAENAGDDGRHKAELIVSLAATVVARHCRRVSSRLLLGIAGSTMETVRGITSKGLLEECMQKLAVARSGRDDFFPDLLYEAMREMTPDTRVVILSTRATDLNDTDRFQRVWNDPPKRGILSQIMCLGAGSPELRACFEPADDVSFSQYAS